MERGRALSLLPILRSRQQGELLARLLGDPELEASLTDLAVMLDTPISSVHREVDRAESAGILTSRKVGNTRLVRADTASPYFEGLADVLVKAFGPPGVLAEELAGVEGIAAACIFGSWATAIHGAGSALGSPVGDIDVLVLGSPDREQLYAALSAAEPRLGRPVQVAVRPTGWLHSGEGNFHATVTQRPMVEIDLGESRSATGASPR